MVEEYVPDLRSRMVTYGGEFHGRMIEKWGLQEANSLFWISKQKRCWV